MAQPTQTEGHVDSVLTNISVAYRAKADQFIAGQVFPIVPVNKQSDLYFVYRKNDWFRDEARRRADATESAGSGYHLGTDSYNADVWAFHKDIGPQAMANFDSPLDAERDAVAFVTQRLLLRQEIQWAADYFTTGKWGTDLVVAAQDQWSDYVQSDPKDSIETAMETILSTTGFKPNTLVVGYQVDRQLRNHPDVRDQNKYTSAESITSQMVARWLGIDRYLVASAIQATNQEGQAEAYSFIAGKNALLCYVQPSPSLLAPSAGYTFMWRGVSRGLGADIGVARLDMPTLGPAVRIEGQIAYDNKIVAADLGYFFSGAVA